MSADLKGNIIKLILALFKHQLELWLGKEFVELATEPLAEIGGEKLEEFLKGRDGPKELIAAGKLADTLFRSRCQDSALLDVLSMDFGDQKAIQAAIKELPEAMDSDVVKASVQDMFQRDFSSILTSEQITNGAELYTDCLLEALVPLEQHALPAIGELVRETLGEVRLLRREQTEEFGFVKEELREIKSRITPTYGGVQPAFLVPFPRNEKFVGRDDDLERLHAALISGATIGVRPAMLSGMGGIGKTQLAVEYAYRHQNDYSGGVYWINAAQDWSVELTRLAEQIGFHSEEENENRRREALSNSFVHFIQKTPGILIIFDNVEDPRQLRQPLGNTNIIPSELHRLLFTTRRRDRDLPFQSIEVRVLPVDAAVHLLLDSDARRAILDLPENDSQQQVARAICRDLGGLPLALALASAYLGRYDSITLDGYQKRIAKEGVRAVDANGIDPLDLPTRHDAAVAATLKSQWAVLKNDDARLVLQAAALLSEATIIPRPRLSLLTGLLDQALEGYPNPFETAVTELQGLCLIEELGPTDVRLHPLVREFVYSIIPDLDSFTAACYERLESALWDMKRLNSEIADRGVDAVIADIDVAIELVQESSVETIFIAKPDLPGLLRTLDREAHHLRKPFHNICPSYILQQIYSRALNLGQEKLQERAEAALQALRLPWLKERFMTSRESPAHIRILEGHHDLLSDVVITPDGEHAISAAWEDTLHLWNINTGQSIRTFKGHSGNIWGVTVTPDSKYFFSTSTDRTLILWDIKSGQAIRTFEGHSGTVWSAKVTPNGKHLISASSDGTLRLWDINTGETIRIFDGHTGDVLSVSITLDGKHLISASSDGTLRLWDINTGETIRIFEGHTGDVLSVSITLDGALAISASSDKTIRLWDINSGQIIRIFEGHSDKVDRAMITPNGKYIVSCSHDKTIRLWDLDSGQILQIFTGHVNRVVCLDITSDGKRAISGSHDMTLRLWDIESRKPTPTFDGHSGTVRRVKVTPDDKYVVSGSDDNTLMLWDIKSGKLIRILKGHSDMVRSLAITSDSKHIISASHDHTLRLWDLHSGKTIRVFQGHQDNIWDVALLPDGKHAVSGSWDRTLRLWDLSTSKTARIFEGHTDIIYSVAVTTDGQQIVSISKDGTLRIWNTNSGRTYGAFQGCLERPERVSIIPGGKFVNCVLGSSLCLWDIDTGRAILPFKDSGFCEDVSVTLDGKYAVSVSRDNNLRLWDINTGQCLLVFASDIVSVSVAFNSTGTQIIAGDQAGVVHFIEICYPENLP